VHRSDHNECRITEEYDILESLEGQQVEEKLEAVGS
jgi:hypothetical protein